MCHIFQVHSKLYWLPSAANKRSAASGCDTNAKCAGVTSLCRLQGDKPTTYKRPHCPPSKNQGQYRSCENNFQSEGGSARKRSKLG